eukprot:gene12583-16874_t
MWKNCFPLLIQKCFAISLILIGTKVITSDLSSRETTDKIIVSHTETRCMNGDYRYGTWKPNNITKKEFICCMDNNPKRPKECDSAGYPSMHHACECDYAFDDPTTVIRPPEKYIWEANRYELTPWSNINICELIGSRKVLLLGDSTMNILYGTLKSMIYAKDPSTKNECLSNRISMNEHHQMQTLRGGAELDISIAHILNSTLPDLILFSKAAHVAIDPDYYPENYSKRQEKCLETWKKDINNIILEIKDYQKWHPEKHIQMVYVTATAGISDCKDYTDHPPLLHRLPAHDWNWEAIYWMNDYAVQNFPSHGIPVIDLSPLDLRPDIKLGANYKHGSNQYDCLHSCIPGPINIFPQFLGHMLTTGEI